MVAREDLSLCVSEIARVQGCSLFELVNDVFQLMVDSDKLDLSLRQVFDERKLLESAKESGFILGFERLWYEMADVFYKNDKAAALKSWFDSGVWFAARYVTAESSAPFVQFKHDLLTFTWNAPEFEFAANGDKLSVRLLSPRFTEGYSFLFASFLTGALEKFGYASVSSEVSRGVIRLDVVRSVVV